MQSPIELSEYEHPDLYDLENPLSEPELAFFLELARQLDGSVLELGCGTGRMTIPLAQAGIDITGLDIVPAMLERAKQKAGDLPIRFVLADARDYHFQQSFALIFELGSVFMHMLTLADQEAFLARVREHLRPDGRFVVSLWFPQADSLEDVSEEKPWYTYQTENGTEVRVSGTEHYDALQQVKLETAYRRWTDAEGSEQVHVAPLSLRYTFPQEMHALLHYNGFKVEAVFGGMDRAPLTEKSTGMLFVCSRR